MASRNGLWMIFLVSSLAATTAHALPVDVVTDGGFEGGTPSAAWSEFSTNFGTPICEVNTTCNPPFGTTGPRSGTHWVWLGGIEAEETAFVSQIVTIPVASIATLGFWLEITTDETGGSFDTFQVTLDGQDVFSTDNGAAGIGYVFHGIDVSSFADGGMHTLKFQGDFDSFLITNFFLDDVSLTVPEPGSLSLLAFGLAGLARWARRGRRFRLCP